MDPESLEQLCLHRSAVSYFLGHNYSLRLRGLKAQRIIRFLISNCDTMRILLNSRRTNIVTQRWKATIATVHPQSSATLSSDDVEWNQAKPFEQIPGSKSRSLIKSVCSMLRAIGNYSVN